MDKNEIAEEIKQLEKEMGKDKLRKLYSLRQKLKRKQEEEKEQIREKIWRMY